VNGYSKQDLLGMLEAKNQQLDGITKTANSLVNSLIAFILMANPKDLMLVIDPKNYPDINKYRLEFTITDEGYMMYQVIPPPDKPPKSKIILPN